MKCSHVKVGGHSVIMCGSRRIEVCDVCQAPASFLCDWRRAAGGTCDKRLCEKHVTQVERNKHLCPVHAKLWAAHPANKQQRFDL